MNRLFDFSNGSLAAVFGLGVHGCHSGKWWHRALVMPVYRVGNRVHRAAWKFRHRYVRSHQYNRIDTLLPPGCYDIDKLMLHGMFALLRRYVESAMGGADKLAEFTADLKATPDQNAPEGVLEAQANSQSEALSLYLWWTESRPAMEKRKTELLRALYSERRMTFEKAEGGSRTSRVVIRPFEGDEVETEREMRGLEAQIDREDQEMLHRLIDIRYSLGT